MLKMQTGAGTVFKDQLRKIISLPENYPKSYQFALVKSCKLDLDDLRYTETDVVTTL